MKFNTLGDPHLGRVFRTGVPLHRIGEREEMVWSEFESNLMLSGADLHVCMGDLFDKFVVPPEVVLRAYDIYSAAAQRWTNTSFVVIRGNHDVSRDTSRMSSFDLFTKLVSGTHPNVKVIDTVTVLHGLGFVPYDPFVSAEDQVRELPDNLTTVFMHHDYTDFGGDHVIPTALLAEKGITRVINGHDHVARTEKRHGVTVEMTGSMQPYSHAEDAEGRLYVTTHLPIQGDVRNKNVRLILRDGEEAPTDLDCLSLIIRREQAEETLEVDTDDFDSFDLAAALAEAVHPDVRDQVMEKFHEQ